MITPLPWVLPCCKLTVTKLTFSATLVCCFSREISSAWLRGSSPFRNRPRPGSSSTRVNPGDFTVLVAAGSGNAGRIEVRSIFFPGVLFVSDGALGCLRLCGLAVDGKSCAIELDERHNPIQPSDNHANNGNLWDRNSWSIVIRCCKLQRLLGTIDSVSRLLQAN